ncbi:MAG TPA: ABC transporter ATP-binding protein [Fredinandcohnia sp.]|nr:ABC transporter ATP-binding protein [Fredinandcohnia sp.]
MAAGVLVDGVSKSYPSQGTRIPVLRDVNIVVEAGEFVCIAGPSGCGKTTLLNIVAGLEEPDEGCVYVDGKRVTGPSAERTVVFQHGALFPWMTVLGNVEYGLRMRGDPREERLRVAQEALDRLGLTEHSHKYPHQISGGQRQRVAIARSLVLEPKVLLCDEPFTALDALTRRRLVEDLFKLWEATRMTVLWVEHNLYLPALLADRVYVLASHPGRVLDEVLVELPRPRLPNDPAVLRVGEWLTRWTEALAALEQGHHATLPEPPEGAVIRPVSYH